IGRAAADSGSDRQRLLQPEPRPPALVSRWRIPVPLRVVTSQKRRGAQDEVGRPGIDRRGKGPLDGEGKRRRRRGGERVTAIRETDDAVEEVVAVRPPAGDM